MTTRKNVSPASNISTPTDLQTTHATDLTEQIRSLAYFLYEQRGREDGFAEQDWLLAEAEILKAKKTRGAAA
jgi:hypothetical protein